MAATVQQAKQHGVSNHEKTLFSGDIQRLDTRNKYDCFVVVSWYIAQRSECAMHCSLLIGSGYAASHQCTLVGLLKYKAVL